MAKSQRHKHYEAVFEKYSDGSLHPFTAEDVSAALRLSFIAEDIDFDSTCHHPAESFDVFYSRQFYRMQNLGNVKSGYESFNVEIIVSTTPADSGHVDFSDGSQSGVHFNSIPQLISALGRLFGEFHEDERQMKEKQEQAAKKPLCKLREEMPKLLRDVMRGRNIAYRYSYNFSNNTLDLYFKVGYRKTFCIKIGITETEDALKEAADYAQLVKKMLSRYKGKISIDWTPDRYLWTDPEER